MQFEDIIKRQTARGYNYHVFQSYGDQRGFSQSFMDYASARKYARKIPEGIVYDGKGNDVTYSL